MLALGAAVFVLFVVIAHVVRWGVKRATRSSHRANVGVVLARLGYFAVIIVGALIAVTIVAPSMTPARLVSVLGLGSIAIGFAFKDLFQNLLAGVLILWREPFREAGELQGAELGAPRVVVQLREEMGTGSGSRGHPCPARPVLGFDRKRGSGSTR